MPSQTLYGARPKGGMLHVLVKLIVICSACAAATPACSPSFGPQVSLFNIFMFGNYTANGGNCGGRLAAQQNISVSSMSVGTELFGYAEGEETVFVNVACPSIPSGFWAYQVVAGNSLIWTGGGNIYSGSAAAGNAAGSSISSSMNNTLQGNGCNFSVIPNLIDFATAQTKVQSLSCFLTALAPTSSVTYQWGGVQLTVSGNSTLEVIHLDAALLLSANSISVTSGTLSSTAVIIFNANGTNCGLQDLSLSFLDALVDNVIWNFPNCVTLTFQSVGVVGVVLAPSATITNPSGDMYGQVIAQSMLGAGSMGYGWYEFQGCIPGWSWNSTVIYQCAQPYGSASSSSSLTQTATILSTTTTTAHATAIATTTTTTSAPATTTTSTTSSVSTATTTTSATTSTTSSAPTATTTTSVTTSATSSAPATSATTTATGTSSTSTTTTASGISSTSTTTTASGISSTSTTTHTPTSITSTVTTATVTTASTAPVTSATTTAASTTSTSTAHGTATTVLTTSPAPATTTTATTTSHVTTTTASAPPSTTTSPASPATTTTPHATTTSLGTTTTASATPAVTATPSATGTWNTTCALNPCLHASSCIWEWPGYSLCACQVNFYGPVCQFKDTCFAHPRNCLSGETYTSPQGNMTNNNLYTYLSSLVFGQNDLEWLRYQAWTLAVCTNPSSNCSRTNPLRPDLRQENVLSAYLSEYIPGFATGSRISSLATFIPCRVLKRPFKDADCCPGTTQLTTSTPTSLMLFGDTLTCGQIQNISENAGCRTPYLGVWTRSVFQYTLPSNSGSCYLGLINSIQLVANNYYPVQIPAGEISNLFSSYPCITNAFPEVYAALLSLMDSGGD